MFSFSFSLGRFRGIKPLKLNCGIDSLNSVLREYSHLKKLHTLHYDIEKITGYGMHPLLRLQLHHLPDVLEHNLDMFGFR